MEAENDFVKPFRSGRVGLGTLFALNAYFLGISFLWNSLHVIVLPAVLLRMGPERWKNTTLGLLTMSGLLLAMVVQPLAGAWSDGCANPQGWRSRFVPRLLRGRRRPFILAGTLLDFVFLALLGWAGGLPWLAAGYIGLQLSSNLAHGPAQGLLPDLVPPEQHGQASAIKNLLDMGGLIAASLLVGRMLDPQTQRPLGVMLLLAAVLALSLLVTLLGVRERPAERTPASAMAGPAEDTRIQGAQRQDARIQDTWGQEARGQDAQGPGRLWREFTSALQGPFGWLVGMRFAFLCGVYGVQAFAQYFVRDVLQAPNPAQTTGDLLAALTLALVAFAVAGGWLGDRFGHRRMLYLACLAGAAGCLLMFSARTPGALLGYGLVFGVGIGLFLTSNWALAARLAPVEEGGKYLGLTNIATAGAGALSRLAGPLIDGLNALAPGEWWGYAALFVVSAAFIAASALVLGKVEEPERAVLKVEG